MSRRRCFLLCGVLWLAGVPAAAGPKAKEASFHGTPLSRLPQKLGGPRSSDSQEILWWLREAGPAGGPLVPALVVTLADSNPKVRRDAAEALGLIGSAAKRAVPALTAAGRDPNKDVRAAAAVALSRVAPRDPAALRRLTDLLADEGVSLDGRRKAAAGVGDLGPAAKAAVPALTAALKDRLGNVRTAAAAALLRVDPGNKNALAAFAGLLADKDRFVCAGAAVALRQLGPAARGAAPLLLTALRHPAPDTRALAAAALGEIGPVTDAVVPALAAALKPPAPKGSFLLDASEVRERAAESLGKFGPKARAAVPELAAALKNPIAPVRLKAAAALLAITPENKDAPAVIVHVLKANPNASGLLAVVEKVGPAAKDAVPTLIKQLGPGRYEQQLNAAQLLGAIGPAAKEAVPTLTRLLTVPPAPRFQFAFVLSRIDPGNADAIALLVKGLQARQAWSTRRQCFRWLRQLGPSARGAVPALTAALDDPDLHMRWEAAQALTAIAR